ncbi:hypothetical protein D9M71_711810 [compost metagenome]
MVDVGDDGDIAEFFDHGFCLEKKSSGCLRSDWPVYGGISGQSGAKLRPEYVGRAVADAAAEQPWLLKPDDKHAHWCAPR